MRGERERERQERWGEIEPMEIMPRDEKTSRIALPPLPPVPSPDPMEGARVLTHHNTWPYYQAICPRCRRPYNPDSPLMRFATTGCYHCGSFQFL